MSFKLRKALLTLDNLHRRWRRRADLFAAIPGGIPLEDVETSEYLYRLQLIEVESLQAEEPK